MLPTKSFRHIHLLKKQIFKTPHIDILLDNLSAKHTCGLFLPGHADCLAGWGYKPTSLGARSAASAKNLTYIALEDGFFRSVGSPSRKPPPHSFIWDDVGIYYRTGSPSRLSKLLEKTITDAQKERAKSLITFIQKHRLTKYNCGLDKVSGEFPANAKTILIVDQVKNDASIPLGQASAHSFQKMLLHAFEDYPDHRLILKAHPDKAKYKGKYNGYLDPGYIPQQIRNSERFHVLNGNYSSWAMFEKAEKVFTVTSALGFEALMAGKEVHCFGTPFYSGYGLTVDHNVSKSSQSQRKIDLETLVYKSLVEYPVYIDPYEKNLCEPERGFEILADLKAKVSEFTQRQFVACGISKWKRSVFEKFLPETEKPIFYEKKPEHALKKARQMKLPLFGWTGKIPLEVEKACAESGIPLIKVEDGFIRSKGLGVNLHPPGSLVFDDCGIYFDPSKPSRLEKMIAEQDCDNAQRDRAQKLRQFICETKVTKYNIADENDLDLSHIDHSKPKHLVLGQYDKDKSVLLGGGEIQTSLGLLEKVRALYSKDIIIYKPHPDVVSGYRDGNSVNKEIKGLADCVVRNTNLHTLFDQVDHIHVLTSLAGFEALMRGKKVHVYGMPFYAGWGLTIDMMDNPARNVTKKIEDVIYAAYIRYPRYLDPVSGLLCSPETAIRRLQEGYGFKRVKTLYTPYTELRRFFKQKFSGIS